VGLGPQNRAEDEVVLADELAHPVVVVPPRVVDETLLDSYGKKPRVSLTM
jgi:hypothetical protein